MSNKVLIASEGMVLTNGEVYGKQVHLSNASNEESWHEITEQEYEEILAKQNPEKITVE